MDTNENKTEKERTNNQFEEKLIAKIKNEKLTPKPRWQFLLKNYVIWISGALALVIGSLAVSVIIYLLKYNDWAVYSQAKKSFLEFFLLNLPYFWIVFLGIFVFIVYYNFKHTENGYRYPRVLLISASIIFSVFLGTIFFAAGIGEKLDNVLGYRAPSYYRVFNPRIDFWSQPEEGRLSGMVVYQQNQSEFLLIDRNRQEWLIEAKKVKSRSGEKIIVGQPVNLLGEKIDDRIFRADEIFPVRAGQGFIRRFDDSDNGPRDFMMPRVKDNYHF